MSEQPITGRELDKQVKNGQKIINQISTQLKANRLEPAALMQRLHALRQTFDAVTAQRAIDQENERLARVFKVSRMIGASLELDEVLELTMDAIIELTGAERSFLMLLENNKLNLKVGRNFDQETLNADDLTISKTVVQRAMDEGTAILSSNAQEDPRFSSQQSVMMHQLSSIMVTPLKIGERIIGVIYVDSKAFVALFSESELHLLNLFGEQVAIAIDNAIEVERREAVLKEQIDELKIEIDEVKKSQQVAQITDNEVFQNLSARAKELRERRRNKD